MFVFICFVVLIWNFMVALNDFVLQDVANIYQVLYVSFNVQLWCLVLFCMGSTTIITTLPTHRTARCFVRWQKVSLSHAGHSPLDDGTTILIDVYSSRSFFCLLQRNSVVTIEIDGKEESCWSKHLIKMVVLSPKGLFACPVLDFGTSGHRTFVFQKITRTGHTGLSPQCWDYLAVKSIPIRHRISHVRCS